MITSYLRLFYYKFKLQTQKQKQFRIPGATSDKTQPGTQHAAAGERYDGPLLQLCCSLRPLLHLLLCPLHLLVIPPLCPFYFPRLPAVAAEGHPGVVQVQLHLPPAPARVARLERIGPVSAAHGLLRGSSACSAPRLRPAVVPLPWRILACRLHNPAPSAPPEPLLFLRQRSCVVRNVHGRQSLSRACSTAAHAATDADRAASLAAAAAPRARNALCAPPSPRTLQVLSGDV